LKVYHNLGQKSTPYPGRANSPVSGGKTVNIGNSTP